MTWSLPTTSNFYKFCAVFGLIIMICPATTVTILTIYTNDMVEKMELVTATLVVKMGHQKRLGKVIVKIPSESTLIEENEKRIREREANLIALKNELTKQEINIEKAKWGLKYATNTIFPAVILYMTGAVLTLFGYRNRFKTQLSKDKKP